jgi:hypothetical protein
MKTRLLIHHSLAVLAAACSAAILFALAHHALGVEVEAASVDPPRVTVASVLGASAVSAALGWSLLAALEAWTDRGRTLWVRTAVIVTVLSLLGPLTTPGFTPQGRVLLCLLHLVVGAVTILALAGPRPAWGGTPGEVQRRASSTATRR